jgi:Copine
LVTAFDFIQQRIRKNSILASTTIIIGRNNTDTTSENASISCHVHLCVAIDFTSSNGYPYDPSSYHYQSKTSSLNDYEETIVTIGNALFGSNKFQCHKSSIPVWGFGAKYDGTVRHIFQCGPTPTVDGVSGVLDAYQSVFESDFIISGPTIYTPVLQAAASKAKRLYDAVHEQSQYVVLLVITDGVWIIMTKLLID